MGKSFMALLFSGYRRKALGLAIPHALSISAEKAIE